MQFGLAVVNDFPPGTLSQDKIAHLRDQVRAAADAGFGSVWLLHHYLGNMETLAPIPTMAALAPHIGSMDIGTNMFILPLSHPVEVAESFATLDHLTNGHVIAGFGMGYRPNEFDAFGIPMADRLGRYEESVQILRELWSGNAVSFTGKHFTIDNERASLRPVRPGGIPIYVGSGVHTAGARRAAALGDAWLVPPHASPERLQVVLAYYRDERERLGKPRDEGLAVRRDMLLDDDQELARTVGQEVRAKASAAYGAYAPPDTTGVYKHLEGRDKADEVADESYIFGDPEYAIARLRELRDTGIDTVILRMQWYDLPQERVLKTLEMFRTRVMPALRDDTQ
ncbi:alkanesulfonate monooxygenase SsuD/methylene tetrahydromethanopterin reductase-like flavin-dependent oxidoreductase (luciferase family) [Marmoricola sp. URHA0025 HA25]